MGGSLPHGLIQVNKAAKMDNGLVEIHGIRRCGPRRCGVYTVLTMG